MPYCGVTKALCERLGVSLDGWGLRHMLLMIKGLSDNTLRKISLLNYGTYVAYNHALHASRRRDLQSTVDSALAHIREAAGSGILDGTLLGDQL